MTTQQIENPAVYDAAYFIAKFEAIPEEQWNEDGGYTSGDKCCAMAHCGAHKQFDAPEAVALRKMAQNMGLTAILVNDGCEEAYQQPTAQQRVLAWLRDAKEAGL